MSDVCKLKYNRGDIVWGPTLHLNTTQYDKRDDVYVSHGKKRPTLIIGLPQTSARSYQTLDFTSQQPKPENYIDFFASTCGRPQTFWREYGFSKKSYLRIFPAEPKYEKSITPGNEKPFDRELLEGVIKQHSLRLLRADS